MRRLSLGVSAAALLLMIAPAFGQDSGRPAKPKLGKARVQKAQGQKTAKAYKVGDKVDSKIALSDVDGKTLKLEDLEDKIVVIDFWSTRCPVSNAYEDRLHKLYETYTKKGVAFLIVDANSSEHEAGYAGIREYVKKHDLPYSILIDKDNTVADALGARTTPHVFILDKGKLVYEGNIDGATNMPEMKQEDVEPVVKNALDALLEGKAVPKSHSQVWGCAINRVPANG